MAFPSSGTSFLVSNTFTVPPLRSTGVNRFLATMGVSDFRPETCRRLCIPSGRWSPYGTLSVGSPRFLDLSFRTCRSLSPRAVPRVHLLIASTRVSDFAISGRLVTTISVTRPKRIRLRCGSHVCFPRLRRYRLSPSAAGRLHVERAITWLGPFTQQERPGFSWRTRGY